MADSTDDKPFALSSGEIASSLWQKLSEHCETRLRELRGRNDGPLNETDTARTRGQIQTFKDLLALGTYEPPSDG